jgi:hypothetical protein
MLDSVSPGCTTYLGAGCAVVAVDVVDVVDVVDAAATSSVPVRVTAVVLLAMRMFAWAGGTYPPMPITTRVSSMLQASTTHADFVHIRKVLSLSFLRISAERCGSTPRHEPMGKERNYAGGTSGR